MVTEPNEGYLLCSLEVVTLFGRTMFMSADMTKQPYIQTAQARLVEKYANVLHVDFEK